MWTRFYRKVPTTPDNAEYGTAALALAVKEISKTLTKLPAILVLGGHRDGLLLVGESCGQIGYMVERLGLL